jgi:hypothetical protein
MFSFSVTMASTVGDAHGGGGTITLAIIGTLLLSFLCVNENVCWF